MEKQTPCGECAIRNWTAGTPGMPRFKGTAGPALPDGWCRPLEGVTRSGAGVFHYFTEMYRNGIWLSARCVNCTLLPRPQASACWCSGR
jgi:hypothetical protein